ncbi:MAG: AAA family ATPase [Clostridia bacterium]|nr:AAA family ATPase [Clostridia bacterium]
MSVSEVKKNTASAERDINIYLSDIWRGFVKFWWIGVICAVLFGGVMFYSSYVKYTPEYKTSATFTVHTENSTLSGENGVSAYSFYYDRGTADQLATIFPYVLQSNMLQKQVCEDLNLPKMPASVSASCVTGTNMITLTTTGSDPKQTYDVLLSVIDNYSSVTEYIIGPTRLVMISPPEMPEEPSNRFDWASSTLKGVLFGVLLCAAWIVLYAVLRRTVRTKEDISRDLNQNCIGVLPQVVFKKYKQKVNSDILITNPLIGNSFKESLRLLRGSIQNNLQPTEKVVMITSTAPGEGKSITTLNLAAMFAKNESKILVIDGDLRDSGISKMLVKSKMRVRTIAESNNGLYSLKKVKALGVDILTFNAPAQQLWKVMRTANFKKLVDSLREEYDLILIDTPPCGIISDAAIIAGAADAALYVIRQDIVLTSSIRAGINTLISTDVKFLGCILNGATGGLGGYGNYYGYEGYRKYYRYGYHYGSYGYGYGKKKKSEKERRR